MMRTTDLLAASLLAIPLLATAPSNAAVDFYLEYDEWASVAGEHRTVGFDEVGTPSVLITDQYADLGVTVPAEENVFTLDLGDGRIVARNIDFDTTIRMLLSEPITSFGVLEVGSAVGYELYLDGVQVGFEPPRPGLFHGIVSDVPFDEVVLWEFDGIVTLDDIYLPPIPAPGGLAILGVALVGGGRRRRRT